MTEFRFLHSSDLHLGRRFANLPDPIRSRLVEARHGVLHRLAQAARAQGAADILIAGDIFDTETPTDPVWRQALAGMAADPGLRWWLLPGNHDFREADALWDRIAAQAPANIHLLLEPAAVSLAPGVTLLPAPVTRKRPGRDLTAWMAAHPRGADTLVLGLAHGPVTDFSEEGDAADDIIPPDRADTAGLDYLGLGDWHGQLQVGPRTWYSGTPERDSFRHSGRGAALAVQLAAGAPPQVTPVETGQFHWQDSALPLLPEDPPELALADLLPPATALRRDHLLRIKASGRATLAARAALQAAAAQVAPEFGHFLLDDHVLATEVAPDDLDQIDRAGALRVAAEALFTRSADPTQTAEDRAISSAALNRLYGFLTEEL